MRRVSCASTSLTSMSRVSRSARSIASRVISWKTMRRRHLRLQDLGQVPGDRLSLAVLVCREQQFVGVAQQLLEVGDALLLVGVQHVQRLEVVFDVDAEARPRLLLVFGRNVGGTLGKVADVSDAGL